MLFQMRRTEAKTRKKGGCPCGAGAHRQPLLGATSGGPTHSRGKVMWKASSTNSIKKWTRTAFLLVSPPAMRMESHAHAASAPTPAWTIQRRCGKRQRHEMAKARRRSAGGGHGGHGGSSQAGRWADGEAKPLRYCKIKNAICMQCCQQPCSQVRYPSSYRRFPLFQRHGASTITTHTYAHAHATAALARQPAVWGSSAQCANNGLPAGTRTHGPKQPHDECAGVRACILPAPPPLVHLASLAVPHSNQCQVRRCGRQWWCAPRTRPGVSCGGKGTPPRACVGSSAITPGHCGPCQQRKTRMCVGLRCRTSTYVRSFTARPPQRPRNIVGLPPSREDAEDVATLQHHLLLARTDRTLSHC